MLFTSEIVRLQNALVKQGRNRSNATKEAFRVVGMSAIEKAKYGFAKSLSVWLTFTAKKYEGETITREAISLHDAKKRGLWQPVGGAERPTHLFVYFDLLQSAVRSAISNNIVSVSF